MPLISNSEPEAILKGPKRILVIPLRYIGDTVLTVPLVRNLKSQFPNASIDMLVSKTTAPLMEVCPYLDECLIEPSSMLARFQLIAEKRYDAVFILRKSVTVALLCKLAGIPTVVGYDKQRFPFGYKRWGLFLDKSARYPSLKTNVPQVISHFGLLKALDIPVQDDYLELWSTPADVETVARLLEAQQVDASKPIAVLHAASASHGKQIDLAKFADSARRLTKSGYQLLTTGTQNDAALYETLRNQHNLKLVNLAGKTTLRETFELYKRTKILLTVDSSPVHIGAAAGIPNIVGVFGPTNERQWAPHNTKTHFEPVFLDLPCRPCYPKECSHNNCRVQLTPEQIADATSKVLK